MTEWNHSFDFVVVGSGGGALVGAITAARRGASVVVLEKRDVLGGSTAMSGGILWIPNNPLMQSEGVVDSYEAALRYLNATIGDAGPASSPQRRKAFLIQGPKMVSALQAEGLEFTRCVGYSDYYPGNDGGLDKGRGIEPAPYDGRSLSSWLDRLQPGAAAAVGLSVMTNEARSLSNFNRSLRTFRVATRVMARTYWARLRRVPLLTNGTSLIGQLVKVALDRDIPLWLETPVEDLILEDGRVVGVRANKDGTAVNIRARCGVLLAAGGFARNDDMRRRYSGEDQPNDASWSVASPGDTGEVLEAAARIGAKTDLMDEAWWYPMPLATGNFRTSTLNLARQRPGTIFVDAAGKRFVNESNAYMEVGQAMYARNKSSRAVPCWLIMDDGYRRRYSHLKGRPGKFPPDLLASGAIKRATTIEELARECGIDPVGLAETVERFNRNAAEGRDPDFGRGDSAYNRALGDPGFKPNPCLGPVQKAPFYAMQVVPSDLGTCGGLVTNEFSQVLDQEDQPISGLYATGNTTATVMGRRYVGPGATIGYSMVFGYIAALHAADQRDKDLRLG